MAGGKDAAKTDGNKPGGSGGSGDGAVGRSGGGFLVFVLCVAAVYLLVLHVSFPTGSWVRDAAVGAEYDRALLGMGLTNPRHATHDDTHCSRFFTGQIATLLANSPCRSIRRAQFVGTDRHGHQVTVAIAWVELPDSAAANAVSTLYRAKRGWVSVWDAPHLHAPPVWPQTACRDSAVHDRTAMLVATSFPAPTSARTQAGRDQLQVGCDQFGDLPEL